MSDMSGRDQAVGPDRGRGMTVSDADLAMTFDFGPRATRKLIAIADRAGRDPDSTLSLAIATLEVLLKAVERGGRVVLVADDGEETEVVGLIAEPTP